MADEYTSIATTPGLADNTVKTMYDFAFGKIWREQPQYRTWVDKRPERPNGPGQSIVLQKYDWLSSAVITAAKTELDEEADIDAVKLPTTQTVTVTAKEYGLFVARTRKLKLFSFADVDTYAVEAVANSLADWQDEMVQDVLVTGTNNLYSNGNSAVGTIGADDTLAAVDIAKAVTKLRAGNVPTWTDGLYVCGAHPKVIHDLRRETGAAAWRDPNVYGTSQADIWRGTIGDFEGVRFVQNNRTRTGTDGASSATVFRSFVMGKEAIVEAVAQEPSVMIAPVTDRAQRFRAVGWYGVLGWALYRNESLVKIHSGSSVATL